MSRASADRKNLKNFEQLFHQLQPRLYAYCCKYIEDNELARDIVQECFINLSEYASSVKMRIKELEIHPELPYALTELYVKEVNALLKESVCELPEKCRLIFMMSRYQNMKNQEIAENLGISVRTVDAQIYNALKILKIKLKDYLPILMLLFPHFFTK